MNRMWMEWSIPLQKLEVGKIQAGLLQNSGKPLTPLSYVDGSFALQHVNILLPSLAVKEYDATTGRLILNLSEAPQVQAKLMALQDYLLNMVYQNQRRWFPDSNRSKDQMTALFQTFVEPQQLHLYCPVQTQDKKYSLSIWKDGIWQKIVGPNVFQVGDMIRVALRLQGISYQMNQTGSWTGRFRVQHRICSIYYCNSATVSSTNLLKNSNAH